MSADFETLSHGIHGLLVTMITLFISGVIELLKPILLLQQVPLSVMQWAQMTAWIVGIITGLCTTFFLFYNNLRKKK